MTSNLELNCVTNRSMFIKHTDNWQAILNWNSITDQTLIYFIDSFLTAHAKQTGWQSWIWNQWIGISSCSEILIKNDHVLLLLPMDLQSWNWIMYVMEVTDLFPWSSSWLQRLNRSVILNFKIWQSEPDVVLNSLSNMILEWPIKGPIDRQSWIWIK
jgi:hypothetical protein